MISRFVLALMLIVPWQQAWATNFSVGDTLPDMRIDSRGEVILDGDDFSYRPWQTPGGLGKVHVFQYMAGRSSSREQTKPFTDRLEAEFPAGSLHFTTVINLDDALWGTGGFVVGEVESNKRKYPNSTFVLDEEGLGRSALGLEKKIATTVVIDAGGTILYFKEGAMSDAEIEATLDLIHRQLVTDG